MRQQQGARIVFTRLALRDRNTPELHDVLANVASEAINEISGLSCGICLEEFSEANGPVRVLKCTRGGGESYFPMHAGCFIDLLDSTMNNITVY